MTAALASRQTIKKYFLGSLICWRSQKECRKIELFNVLKVSSEEQRDYEKQILASFLPIINQHHQQKVEQLTTIRNPVFGPFSFLFIV